MMKGSIYMTAHTDLPTRTRSEGDSAHRAATTQTTQRGDACFSMAHLGLQAQGSARLRANRSAYVPAIGQGLPTLIDDQDCNTSHLWQATARTTHVLRCSRSGGARTRCSQVGWGTARATIFNYLELVRWTARGLRVRQGSWM